MEIVVTVAKTPKFGVGVSGDTVEVAERPQGGISLVLSDGQGSGEAAKKTSRFVVAKAVALIADGARDSAVAHAVHDSLYSYRGGKVSATLCILTADLGSKEVVISHNSNCPVIVRSGRAVEICCKNEQLIGAQPMVEPEMRILPLEAETVVFTFTDGVLHAGRRAGRPWSLEEIAELADGAALAADGPADLVLETARERDQGRPGDDMTVVAMAITRRSEEHDIRRMRVSMPV